MNKLWKLACDWCWWVFIIRRNEFHNSLNLNMKRILNGKTSLHEDSERVCRVRSRAHELDLKWG